MAFIGGYGSYRYATRRERPLPEFEAQLPSVELATVTAELGRSMREDEPVWTYDLAGRPLHGARVAIDPVDGPTLAFDRRTPFVIVRETLAAMDHARVRLQIEVAPRGGDPYRAALAVDLDRAATPEMFERDRALRAEWLDGRRYTGVSLTDDATVLHLGERVETHPVLRSPGDRESRWDATMWRLANRGTVSRQNGRTPYLFVDDERPWFEAVTALEALAPPMCQPHRGARNACDERWATLYVGRHAPPARERWRVPRV